MNRVMIMLLLLLLCLCTSCRVRPTANPDEQPDAERLRRGGLNVF